LPLKKIRKLTALLIVVSLIGTSLLISFTNIFINGNNVVFDSEDENSFPDTSGVMHYINLDGVINEPEWATAQYKTQFWLNVDANHINGNNYLYLGEDKDNLYLALDLCSDNTSDETGEWLGLWLNTDNSIYSNQGAWEENVENGAEFLMHDVQNNRTWPYFDKNKAPTTHSQLNVNNTSEIKVVNGTLSGVASDIGTYNDGKYMQLNSTLNLSNYSTRLDFEINVSKNFLSNVIQQNLLENIEEIRISLNSRTNTTITSNKIVFWYSNGTYNLNDPNQIVNINSGGWGLDQIYFGAENLNPEKIMKFSIIGNHSSAFSHDLDAILFTISTYHVNTPVQSFITTPYSSINNYEIKWSFGPSSNNATNHRMFEIKIPKNELQNYETAEDLGIIIGGYGTLSFVDSGYWVYGKTVNIFRYYWSSEYHYYNMNMKPFNPPGAFVLSSDAGTPDPDGEFNLNWDSSNGADNYSIYAYDVSINEINESNILLHEGLINNSIPITNLSQGIYYYLAVAYNETGYQLSNILEITVGTPGDPLISGYEVYLIVALTSSISLGLVWWKKRNLSIKN